MGDEAGESVAVLYHGLGGVGGGEGVKGGGSGQKLFCSGWKSKNIPERKWVILDDDYRQFPQDCPELVRCQPKYGLGESVVIGELKRRFK